MKRFYMLAAGTMILSISCGNDAANEPKKPWTEKERKEFRDGCFLSARFSFEQMKQAVDSADIVSICDCTADEIEAQHNFAAAKRIPKAEVNKILEKALEKCAPQAMEPETMDTMKDGGR